MNLNIIIYSNCAGLVLKVMFENHMLTKCNSIYYLTNYKELSKTKLEQIHKQKFNNCDIFIYQPMNKYYDYSEYNIDNIKPYLKNTCKILRVNYYRTRAFWYNNNYIPYTTYGRYSFHTINGIFQDFKNVKDKLNKEEIIKFIDDIYIDHKKYICYFNEEVDKLKMLDESSDVKMYDFFILNYNDKLLFFDPFHPTNIFFYEIFRQLVEQIFGHKLPENDIEFLNKSELKYIEMTHWTIPILPSIKKILNLNYENTMPCFHSELHPKRLYINAYDYYYIRLSPSNFKNYLENL